MSDVLQAVDNAVRVVVGTEVKGMRTELGSGMRTEVGVEVRPWWVHSRVYDPFVAGVRVRAKLDAISDKVPHVWVGRRVVLLHAQRGSAFRHLAFAHVHEDLQALLFGAVSPRRRRLVLARLGNFSAGLMSELKEQGAGGDGAQGGGGGGENWFPNKAVYLFNSLIDKKKNIKK